jgi:hypothetical protein
MAAGAGGRQGDGMDIVQTTAGRRRLLQVNTTVCALSGLVAVAAGGWLAGVLDVPTTAVRVVGAALLVFAAGVGSAARAPDEQLPGLVRLVGWADAAWVTATVVLVAAGAFSGAGTVLALASGVVVAGFAYVELRP